jgi:2-haloacid dehalogenase/putative hydrolase of the HAD superfamily
VCKSAFGEAFVTQREAARASLVGVLAATGCPLDPHELTAAQFNHWRRPPLFEETRCFLERLRLPVCVVSNIGRSDLDAALEHHRLSFDHIVTSEDVRAYKPRPEPFTAALALLQASPEDVVHVGDSLSSDAAGASASRIPFAWVNRKRRQRPAETELWADVTDLTALAERIERR